MKYRQNQSMQPPQVRHHQGVRRRPTATMRRALAGCTLAAAVFIGLTPAADAQSKVPSDAQESSKSVAPPPSAPPSTQPAPPASPPAPAHKTESGTPPPDDNQSARRVEQPPESLDDLLGIPSEKIKSEEAGGADAPASATSNIQENDLTKRLLGGAGQPGSSQDLGALFMSAVASMHKSTELIASQKDVGLVTQRSQEDAIRKLDTLLKAIEKQSNQQQNQSPSQQPQQNPQNQPQKDQQNQAQHQNQTSTLPSQGQDARPPLQQRALDSKMSESRVEWGNLPARVREMLRQGRSDASARLYERLTEEYYRRLADESEK